MADPAKPGREDSVKDAPKSHVEKDATLETALEDTFPASDPPASGSPTKTVGWEEPAPEDGKKD
ncbi:hypothetical protein [Roseomonas haemaphysalidis]|uniref:Uncharacterized protein n=1 Tax=Roseomonas haemaphysalidis TaxID=2768162 RepID=A0ABS3KML5_9PROT|nr:hypothetical protein [Roseomonas haemaphysalidis]MBO1078215.1 hypothetical protein [Roseomonas haemaphysalidis]